MGTIASLAVALTMQHEAFVNSAKASGSAVKDLSSGFRSASQTIAALRTPTEEYQRTLANLQRWHETGKISTEQFERATGKLKERFAEVGKEGAASANAIARAWQGAAHVFESLGGVELLLGQFDKLKQGFEEVAQIGRNALRLGLDVDQMSRFQHAANATHTEIGSLTVGMDKLSQAVGKAMNGEEGAKGVSDAFRKLGLDARELSNLSPDETFTRTAQALSHLHSAYERANAVRELFGRGGRELIPLFAHLNELLRESDDIGFTRTAEQFERVEESERRLVAVTDQLKTTWMDLASSGIVQQFIKDESEALRNIHEFGLTRSIDLTLGGGESQEAFRGDMTAKAVESMQAQQKHVDELRTALRGVGDDLKEQLEVRHKLIKAEEDLLHVTQMVRANTALPASEVSGLQAQLRADREHIAQLQKGKDEQDAINRILQTQASLIAAATEEQANLNEEIEKENQKRHENAIRSRDALRHSAAEMIEHLREQNDVLRFGQEAVNERKVFELSGDAGLAQQYHDLAEQHAGLEAQKKALAEVMELVKRGESPLDRMIDQINLIDDAFSAGAISVEQFEAALAAANEQYERSAKHDTARDHDRGPGEFKEIDRRNVDIRGLMLSGGKEEGANRRHEETINEMKKQTLLQQKIADNPTVTK